MSRRAFYCWRQKGLPSASELDLFRGMGHLALLSGGGYSCCRKLQCLPIRWSQPVCDNQLHRQASPLTGIGRSRTLPTLLAAVSDCRDLREVPPAKLVLALAPLKQAYGRHVILPSTQTGLE